MVRNGGDQRLSQALQKVSSVPRAAASASPPLTEAGLLPARHRTQQPTAAPRGSQM